MFHIIFVWGYVVISVDLPHQNRWPWAAVDIVYLLVCEYSTKTNSLDTFTWQIKDSSSDSLKVHRYRHISWDCLKCKVPDYFHIQEKQYPLREYCVFPGDIAPFSHHYCYLCSLIWWSCWCWQSQQMYSLVSHKKGHALLQEKNVLPKGYISRVNTNQELTVCSSEVSMKLNWISKNDWCWRLCSHSSYQSWGYSLLNSMYTIQSHNHIMSACIMLHNWITWS